MRGRARASASSSARTSSWPGSGAGAVITIPPSYARSAVEKAVERLCRSRRAAPERYGQLERELADVEARIQRGLDALLAGTAAADELQARLKAERARKAVTNRIRQAVVRIGAAHERLGLHFANAVHTGSRCAYTPDRPTPWET